MPLSAVDLFGTISVSHATGQATAESDQHLWAALGHRMMRSRCQSEKPRTSAFPAVFGSTCGSREGIEVQRNATPSADEIHFGQFTDAKPEDEQRNQSQVTAAPRNIVQGRIDGGLTTATARRLHPGQPRRGRRAAGPRRRADRIPREPRPAFPFWISCSPASKISLRCRQHVTGMSPVALNSCHTLRAAPATTTAGCSTGG